MDGLGNLLCGDVSEDEMSRKPKIFYVFSFYINALMNDRNNYGPDPCLVLISYYS